MSWPIYVAHARRENAAMRRAAPMNVDPSPTLGVKPMSAIHQPQQSQLFRASPPEDARARGVRREGVTAAARNLQLRRLIQHRRGGITVIDRPLLEEACCECYAVVKQGFDRRLPHVREH
jgi:hypothetical protein